MQEIDQNLTSSNSKEKMKSALRSGPVSGIFVSLVTNRAIIWSILNGDNSDIKILLLITVLLIIGATWGAYTLYPFKVYLLKQFSQKLNKK